MKTHKSDATLRILRLHGSGSKGGQHRGHQKRLQEDIPAVFKAFSFGRIHIRLCYFLNKLAASNRMLNSNVEH